MKQVKINSWSPTHTRIRAELFLSSITFAMLTNFSVETIRFPFNVVTFTDGVSSKLYIFQIGALLLSLYFLVAIWLRTKLERGEIVPLRAQIGARINEMTVAINEASGAVRAANQASLLSQTISEKLTSKFRELLLDASVNEQHLMEIVAIVSDIKLRLDHLPVSSEEIIKDLELYEKTLSGREGNQHGLTKVGDFLTLAERIDPLLDQIGSFAKEELHRYQTGRSVDIELLKAELSEPLQAVVDSLTSATDTIAQMPSDLKSAKRDIKGLLQPDTQMELYTKGYLDWVSALVPIFASISLILIGFAGWLPEDFLSSMLSRISSAE